MNEATLGYKCILKARYTVRKMDRRISYWRDAYNYSFRPKDVKARLKRIDGGYRGTNKEYRDVVLAYWRKFNQKPGKYWFDLFCAGMDAYDPRFIPTDIYYRDIVPYFNTVSMIPAYADKGIYHKWLPDVAKPETIVKNIAGHYYDGDGERAITREEAERICEPEEHLIIKPTGGSKGSGILFYDRDDEKSMRVSDIFDAQKGGFVVQRLVKQHPDLARLNPSSLNTIRVISFRFQGEVHILSAQLRIGGSSARVDNVSAGGCACAIYPDGRLHEKSVTRRSTWTDETANGIKLSTVRIPNYECLKETVKRLHCELPYFNIVGWDFAVGEDGTPIMVEFNTRPEQNQIGGREPTFGDLTDEVLEDVFIKKTLKDAFKR